MLSQEMTLRSGIWRLRYKFDIARDHVVPTQIVLFDERGVFDVESFINALDYPARWSVERCDDHDAVVAANDSDILIACGDSAFRPDWWRTMEAVAKGCRFSIAIMGTDDSEVPFANGFDSALRSDDPRSWQAFLHLLIRGGSQLIGVDLADIIALWRGRTGRMFRRPYGPALSDELKSDLDSFAVNSPISAVQMVFCDWSRGLSELDQISSKILSTLGEIDLSIMGIGDKTGAAKPEVEMVVFSDNVFGGRHERA